LPAEAVLTDRVGHIETRGIDFIPDQDRHSRPASVAMVFFASQLNFGTMIVGALPVAFGLSFWASFTSIVAGTVLGGAGFAGMVLIGSRTGTNGTVSSGAFFGIRGRFIGTLITEIIDIGYFALGFWVGPQPLVEAAHRLFGTATGGLAFVIALIISVGGMLAVALLGHATIVAYEKLTIFTGITTIAVLLLFAAINLGNQHHVAPHYALGGFWPSWTMALTAQIANAISYGPFASDYARYVPSTTQARPLFLWAFGGMFVGAIVALGGGSVVGLAVADPENLIHGMIWLLPAWLVIPVILLAFVANTANGAMVAYNGVLNLHAMLWRLTWLQVAGIFAVLGSAIGCAGLMVAGFNDRIDAVCSVVTILVTPWVMINIIGYLEQRGRFNTADLQDFNHRDPGNIYWYWHGYSLRAVIAWAISTAIGMLFSNTHLFVGPLARLAGGVDLSFVSSAILGGILYIALGQLRTVAISAKA
jgi:purine-cytosine permease-like protein